MYLISVVFSYCCMIRYIMCTRVLGLGFIDSKHSMTKDIICQILLVATCSYVATAYYWLFSCDFI